MIRLAYERISPGQGHEAGRALLARIYREYRGTDMPPIVVEAGGKPRFVEDTVHFSISHTRRHVFCAISDRPVGIDAEEMDRQMDLRLADKILSPGEKTRYEAAPDKRAALLKLWVLKEASVKHTGEGLRGYPNRTEFSTEDPRVQEIDGCYVAVIGGDHVV